MGNYNPFYKHIQQASILSEYVIKRKFATYKIVSFELISGGPEHRDIYRMSDNPPVWLGKVRCDMARQGTLLNMGG